MPVASGVEDQNSVKDQQAAKLAQTTAGGQPMPQHDWMHHFQLPRFLSPTNTGQSSATAADSPNPSGHQMLAESFRRRSFSTQEELPSFQVPPPATFKNKACITIPGRMFYKKIRTTE